MPASILLEFAESQDESVASRYHDTLGRWIRNNWGLWEKGPLYNDLHKRGLQHPDDMSGVILTSFWRRLHEQPVNVGEQITRYQRFWEHVRTKGYNGAPLP